VSSLRIERHGHVTVFTLDRPEKRNAYDDEMMAAITDGFLAFEADPEQYVAVVTGAGDTAFCSGNDLSTPMGGRQRTGPRAFPMTDMMGIGAVSKPVIAAVNGLAVAGGCEIALACDIRIAADSAWFGLFEPKRGLVPGTAVQLLPRMLSYGDASWFLLTAARVDAAEAHRIGLVQKVVPATELMGEALQVAEGICTLSQFSVQTIKKLLRHHRDLLLKESLEYGAVLSELFNLGPDVDEGIQAFREKREPRFSNRWPSRPA
jgi:enoyl-CoA hydratase/carnithine racemase